MIVRIMMITALLLASAELLPAMVAEQQGVEVSTKGRANVRYGPSTQARVITTLPAESSVLVLEAVDGRDGWFAVAFPRAGHAWVHEKIVEATDDEQWFRVVEDGGRVRSDARINAELVTELAYGELVEFKGRKVGDWLAIHPSGARAYMFHSVLDMSPQQETALRESGLRNDENQRRWQLAKLRYEYYRKIFAEDSSKALRLDWQGLNQELDLVVADHPTIRTRLQAKRLQDNIARVVRAAVRYQHNKQIRPLPDPEFRIPEPQVAMTQVAPTQPNDPPPPTPNPQPDPTPPQPDPKPDDEPPAIPNPPPTPPSDPAPPADPQPQPDEEPDQESLAHIADADLSVVEAAAQASSPQLVGWLEQRDDPGIGTSYALLDGSGEVVAFVRSASGAGLSLSEYIWRRIELQGESQPVAVTLNGRERTVPLLNASAIRLAD